MGEQIAARAGRALAGLVLFGVIGSGITAGEVEPWMPETLPGFLRALELGIAQDLTPRERDTLASRTHEELRETHPELHDKISRGFVRWTDAWVQRAARELETVPEPRIRRAEQAAAEVDHRVRSYFEARGWAYRPMRVVFLPRRLMTEPGLPSIQARGIYLRYYPEVFFTTLEPDPLTRHTLIHEILHLNESGPDMGRALTEGIAEAAAAHLALEWGMVSRRALREANAYPRELELVAYLLDRMTERTGMPRAAALEILLHTYLTGDSTEVTAILGDSVWSEIVKVSLGHGKVRKVARRLLGS